MVSSTSVQRSHAETSSVEETHASKPQAQSSIPMNHLSTDFIQIDRRKWSYFLACDNVDKDSLAWKISKRLTALARHRKIEAVHRSALFPQLRRDFEREGARTVSYSQWLGHIYRGSNKPRFQCRVDSNNNLLHVRAIQGHSGGELIAPELLNHVAIPPRWKEYLYHVGSFFAVNSILQAGLIAGGRDTEEGRQTVFFTFLDPTR